MAIAPLMGVCSSALQYDITDDGRVTGIRFAGGCPGNLEAVARLAEGSTLAQVVCAGTKRVEAIAILAGKGVESSPFFGRCLLNTGFP